jgi:GH24 family phage-related lysozyme (muramidase)
MKTPIALKELKGLAEYNEKQIKKAKEPFLSIQLKKSTLEELQTRRDKQIKLFEERIKEINKEIEILENL